MVRIGTIAGSDTWHLLVVGSAKARTVLRRYTKGIAAQDLLLDRNWDWERAVSSLKRIASPLLSAVRADRKEICCWLEFGDNQRDSRYYVVTPVGLYQRGGFRLVPWDDLREFASRPRALEWGNIFVARAFSLDECTPQLEMSRVLGVFGALKEIPDGWRGMAPVAGLGTAQTDAT